MALALSESYAETGDRWRPWAANGRHMRVGEIVLIVDSDTVVPEVRFGCMSLSFRSNTSFSRTASEMLHEKWLRVQLWRSSSMRVT